MVFLNKTSLTGRHHLVCGLTTALFLALAMPGKTGWWPLLFIALVPQLLVCLYARPLQSALVGFLAGFFYHLLLIYWIVIVLSRYGGLPLWLSVCSLVLLSAYMGLYNGLFCYVLSRLAGRWWHRERSVTGLVWCAPVIWVGLEYLRSFLFSGFPWMDLGYGLYTQPQLIQAADLGGHLVISFVLVLCNGFVLGLIDRQRNGVRWNIRMERRLLLMAGAFIVFFFGYSYLRYDVMSRTVSRGLQAHVGIVQGNIAQGEKWSLETKERTVRSYLRLSETLLGKKDVELIVWPETALPFYLQIDPLGSMVRNFVTEHNMWLLTGSPAYDIEQSHENGPKEVRYFNSALLLDSTAVISGRYDKQHLVPFGEYIPLSSYLSFLSPLVESVGNFTAGTSSTPLEVGRISIGTLICFESIFPDIARESVAQGANLLVNLTNDAWYGRSSAPYQSLAMAVFRTVENKRSMVRAANTGISAFIDPVGNITLRTEIFTEDARAAKVVLWEDQTIFSRSGYLFGLCCLCAAAAVFSSQLLPVNRNKKG